MKLLLAAAPGVAALVVAVIALARIEDAPEPEARAQTAQAAPGLRELFARVDGVVARVDAFRDLSDPPFGNGRRDAIGAGFVIDGRGHLVTNAHVVDRARSATVRFGRSARRIPARIVGVDRATDLAVLRVDPARLGADAPLELAPDGSTRVGDPVLAVGTPHRLQGSASAGIVSALGREIEGLTGFAIPDVVQTDAAINPGNSGGPLIDAAGRVVGVNTQGRRDAQGLSFAISASTVRRVVPQLIQRGRAQTAFLGVSVGDVTPQGSRVRSVAAGSPAQRAGLRAGDMIARIGARATNTDGSVASAVAARPPGERVEIRILRGDRERSLRARLGRQPTR